MIRRIFLIARQEFLKYVTRRGFLFSLLLAPLFLSLSIAVPTLFAPHPKTNVIVIVDRTGLYAGAIAAAVARDDAQTGLAAFADYAAAHADMAALGRADPALAAILRAPGRPASLKAYLAQGGWQHALAALSPFLRPGAPRYAPPVAPMAVAAPPPGLLNAGDAAMPALARVYLAGKQPVRVGGVPQFASTVLLIPRGFAADGLTAARYMTADDAARGDAEFVRRTLADALRLRALQQLLPPGRRAALDDDVEANLETVDPTQAAGASLADRLGQFMPMGLAVLLFIVSFSNSALLLQSVLEEKTTRMIEVLASCASPTEIMTGKLLGVFATALVTVAVWAAALFAIGSLFSPAMVVVVLAGLAKTATMSTLPLIVLYFLCGILIYSAIFLGIGSVTSSLPDAQALLGPTSLIIMLPMIFVGVVARDPNGAFATAVSWIPIYTPIFMLVRLPFHPPAVQLVLTSALVIATTLLLLRQIGRLFARHLLSTQSAPNPLAALFSRAERSR